MNLQTLNFSLAMPEIIVLAAATVALVVDVFVSERYKGTLAYFIVQLGLIAAAALTFTQFNLEATVAFNGHFVVDRVALLTKLFIYLSAFGAFLYSRHYIAERNMPRGEYYILGLFSTLGMMVLVSAHSFLTIYLGLELLSLPLYAMVALRRDSFACTEAAIKYFIMGAVASGMLLYGMSMLYGATGSLDIALVAQTIAAMPEGQQLIISFGLVFVVVGLGFKLAAAPFHMWAPDVYTGAPTSVTIFLGTAPKVAALGMAVRLLLVTLPLLQDQWQQLLIVLSILSMGVGNLIAIAQTNIKRMLAYSAIAHTGYMLLGLLAGTPAGYSAALFYILIYAIMSLGGFGMITLLSRAGLEAENISDFKGMNSRSPWLAFIMLLIMFSMAGIPPTVGFFAKLLVLKSLIDAQMVWLAVLALFFAIIGAFYYIRIIKTMYFDAPETKTAIACPMDMRVAISVNGLALLALGLFPGALIQACRLAFG